MRKMIIMIATIAILAAGCQEASTRKMVSGHTEKQLLRIGVYDSRGIAIAYAHSGFNDERYRQMKAQLDAAQAAGDEQKVAEIKQRGKDDQAKKHLQGFGTAPVHEYLEVVKDRIPEVAKVAGVDVIVSKWETDFLADDVETVDVTMELAKLFNPKEKAYQWIEQMKDQKPIDHAEIRRLEKEDPNF